MDNFTYGDSEASVTLVKIIEQYSKEGNNCSKKVGRIFTDFTIGNNAIVSSNIDNGLKEVLLGLWHNRMDLRIQNASLPNDVKSYLRNAISTIWKQSCRRLYGE